MSDTVKALAKLRKSKMSMAQAARNMGVSRQQVYNIENEVGSPTIKTLERYASAIGAQILIQEQIWPTEKKTEIH